MSDVVAVASSSAEGMSSDELDKAILRLPKPEQSRARNLRLEMPRRAFVLGRLLLRTTVARVADVAPEGVVIDLEPTGRPRLTGELSHYFVSIAHSASRVVVGVAKRQVGVDVEQLQQSPPQPRLMARVCSPDELRVLEVMNDADRAAAFMTVWTRKEAYGKAVGHGLDFPLSSVTVGVSGSTILGGKGDWHAADIDVDPRCAAAVVAQGGGWRVQLDQVEHRSL